MENWKSIKGFGKTHIISDLGRVKRLKSVKNGPYGTKREVKSKYMGLPKSKFDYVYITLTDGTNKISSSVHREVWKAFKGDIPKGFVINHINGIKSDNRLINLECITQSDNQKHAYKTGLYSTKNKHNC